MFHYEQMEVWGLTLCFAWVYFKAAGEPSGSVEERSKWQSPGTVGCQPQLGAGQSSGQPQDPGGTKTRQMFYITTNKITYISFPRWNAPDSFQYFLFSLQLAIPVGDTSPSGLTPLS